VNEKFPQQGNHRYVADEAVRQQMRARSGWHEEGIAFCVLGAQRSPISVVGQAIMRPAGRPPYGRTSGCPGGYEAFAVCVLFANMPLVDTTLGPISFPGAGAYAGLTGYTPPLGSWVATYSQASPPASRSFAQMGQSDVGGGFYVTSRDRIAGDVSSIRTITRGMIDSTAISNSIRQAFLPTFEVDMDLLVAYRLFVKHVSAEGPGNDAYVQALVSFVDNRSGKRLIVSPGAIGTPVSGDVVVRDAASDDVLVYIALGPGFASVGRNTGLPSLTVPKIFGAFTSWGYGGDFAWRVNRGEFRTILARARALEPTLSDEPGDYVLEGIGMKGEVVGAASIGFNFQQASVSIVRP
jgi:hypothetical protein